MWNNSFCSFGPLFGSGHWFGGWIFPLLFWGLIIWAMISLLQKIFVSTKSKQKEGALDILKRRYAAGEIDQKRFEEMKATIAVKNHTAAVKNHTAAEKSSFAE